MPVTQNYDTGVDIRNQRDGAQAAMGDANPLMDALKTLQMYVTSQKEQGNEAPGAAFLQFLNTLGGGQQAEQPEQAPEGFDPFSAPPAPQQAPARQEGAMPGGMRPEMQGKARVMAQ